MSDPSSNASTTPPASARNIPASQTRALARALAVVWPAVMRDRRPADRVLADFLRQHPEFGGRDRRLIGDTIFGLFRWWGWLRELAPAAMRAGAFAADVSEADWGALFLALSALEGLPRGAPEAYWSALANRSAEEVDAVWTLDAPVQRLAALTSRAAESFPIESLLPDWVGIGIDCPRPAAELIAWLQRRPPLWLRVQAAAVADVMAELTAAGLAPSAPCRLPGALRLDRARVSLQALPAYREGRIEVQDISSQAIVAVCGAQTGERWWDACAGTGGKTLALALAVGPGGHVRASDVRADALAELRRRVRRAGLAQVTTAAVRHGDLPHDWFDGVLVDAPCSGTGTWRRNPWSRWQLVQSDVARLAGQQAALLAAAATRVRPGGCLVYATCSLLRAENDAIVDGFGAAHPEFQLEPFAHPLTGRDAPGALTIWPWDADGDAMFVARLRRRG